MVDAAAGDSAQASGASRGLTFRRGGLKHLVPVSSTSAKVNLYAREGFVVFKRSRVEFQSLASQVSSMRAGCFERGAWVSSKTLCTARTTQRGQGGCRGTRQRPKLGQLFWPCQRKLHPFGVEVGSYRWKLQDVDRTFSVCSLSDPQMVFAHLLSVRVYRTSVARLRFLRLPRPGQFM